MTEEKTVKRKKPRVIWRVFLIIGIVISSAITTVFASYVFDTTFVKQGEIELREDIANFLDHDFCLFLDDRVEYYNMRFPDGTVKKVPERYGIGASIFAASQDEMLFCVHESNWNASVEVVDFSFNLKRTLLQFDKREYRLYLLDNGFALYKKYKNVSNDERYIINLETGEVFDYDSQLDVTFDYNISANENGYIIKEISTQALELSISYENIDSEFLNVIKKWGYKLTRFEDLFDGTYCCIFNRTTKINNWKIGPNIPLYMQINGDGEILKYHTHGVILDNRICEVIGVREQIAESFNFA